MKWELALFILSVILVSVFGRKANKASLPDGISREVYCAGCRATLMGVEKAMAEKGKSLKRKLPKVLDQACALKWFKGYDVKQADLVVACNHITEVYADVFEKEIRLFYKHEEVRPIVELIEKICRTEIKACGGGNKIPQSEKINIDGLHVEHEQGEFNFKIPDNAVHVKPVREKKTKEKSKVEVPLENHVLTDMDKAEIKAHIHDEM